MFSLPCSLLLSCIGDCTSINTVEIVCTRIIKATISDWHFFSLLGSTLLLSNLLSVYYWKKACHRSYLFLHFLYSQLMYLTSSHCGCQFFHITNLYWILVWVLDFWLPTVLFISHFFLCMQRTFLFNMKKWKWVTCTVTHQWLIQDLNPSFLLQESLSLLLTWSCHSVSIPDSERLLLKFVCCDIFIKRSLQLEGKSLLWP